MKKAQDQIHVSAHHELRGQTCCGHSSAQPCAWFSQLPVHQVRRALKAPLDQSRNLKITPKRGSGDSHGNQTQGCSTRRMNSNALEIVSILQNNNIQISASGECATTCVDK
jgi:hypothetical protein